MDEGQDRVQAAYRGNYGRLAQVKGRYDHFERRLSGGKRSRQGVAAAGCDEALGSVVLSNRPGR
jgi:hypothetical protein